jgi:hypothetical protein
MKKMKKMKMIKNSILIKKNFFFKISYNNYINLNFNFYKNIGLYSLYDLKILNPYKFLIFEGNVKFYKYHLKYKKLKLNKSIFNEIFVYIDFGLKYLLCCNTKKFYNIKKNNVKILDRVFSLFFKKNIDISRTQEYKPNVLSFYSLLYKKFNFNYKKYKKIYKYIFKINKSKYKFVYKYSKYYKYKYNYLYKYLNNFNKKKLKKNRIYE